MLGLDGSCVCGSLRFRLTLQSKEDARTSLCHCHSCRRAFGTNFGLTTKVPLESFTYNTGTPSTFKQENGVTREFCTTCGTFICEYGEQAANKFRYVMWGALDEPDKLPPTVEFFCNSRAPWMPEVPGLVHKAEIKI